MANAFMTLDKWVYPAHEVDAEIAELKGQRDELLKALQALHPRQDIWITPNDELADYIERAMAKATTAQQGASHG